jgi:hypothetical protein
MCGSKKYVSKKIKIIYSLERMEYMIYFLTSLNFKEPLPAGVYMLICYHCAALEKRQT